MRPVLDTDPLRAGLPGPSRRIVVEPVEVPVSPTEVPVAPAQPAPAPAPDPAPVP